MKTSADSVRRHQHEFGTKIGSNVDIERSLENIANARRDLLSNDSKSTVSLKKKKFSAPTTFQRTWNRIYIGSCYGRTGTLFASAAAQGTYQKSETPSGMNVLWKLGTAELF